MRSYRTCDVIDNDNTNSNNTEKEIEESIKKFNFISDKFPLFNQIEGPGQFIALFMSLLYDYVPHKYMNDFEFTYECKEKCSSCNKVPDNKEFRKLSMLDLTFENTTSFKKVLNETFDNTSNDIRCPQCDKNELKCIIQSVPKFLFINLEITKITKEVKLNNNKGTYFPRCIFAKCKDQKLNGDDVSQIKCFFLFDFNWFEQGTLKKQSVWYESFQNKLSCKGKGDFSTISAEKKLTFIFAIYEKKDNETEVYYGKSLDHFPKSLKELTTHDTPHFNRFQALSCIDFKKINQVLNPSPYAKAFPFKN